MIPTIIHTACKVETTASRACVISQATRSARLRPGGQFRIVARIPDLHTSGNRADEDAGTLYPKRMETVDDEIRDFALKFIDKAKADNKPFFLWLNPTRMHIVTHLSPKYQALRNSKNGWTIHEAGMAQLDDDVGIVMQKLKDM